MPDISQRQIKNLALFLSIILISSLTISITIHCCKRCCRSKNKNSKSNLTAPNQRANFSKKSGKTKKTAEIAQLNDLDGNGNNNGTVKKMNFVESTMGPTTDDSKNTPSSNYAQLLGECPEGGETVNVPIERETDTKFGSKVNSLKESFTKKIGQEYKKNTEGDEGLQAAKKNKAVASVIASVKARRNGTSSLHKSADSDKSDKSSASPVLDDCVFNQESNVTPADKSNTESTNESSATSNNQDMSSNGNIQSSDSAVENVDVDVSQQSSCNILAYSKVITNQSEVNAKDQDENADASQSDTPTYIKLEDVVFEHSCLDYREVVNLSNYLHLINTADDISPELRNEFITTVIHQFLRPYNCIMPDSFSDVVEFAKSIESTNMSTTAGTPEASKSDLATTLQLLNAILHRKTLTKNLNANTGKPKKGNYKSMSKSAIPVRLNREKNADRTLMSYTEVAADQVQYKLSFNPLAAANTIASFLNAAHLQILICDTKEYMEYSKRLQLATLSDADKEKLSRAIRFADNYHKTLKLLVSTYTKHYDDDMNKAKVERSKIRLGNNLISEVENYITVLLIILDVYTSEREQKVSNMSSAISTADTDKARVKVTQEPGNKKETSTAVTENMQANLLNSWYYDGLYRLQKIAANPTIFLNEIIQIEADLLFEFRKMYARGFSIFTMGDIYPLDVFEKLHEDEQKAKSDLAKTNALLRIGGTESCGTDKVTRESVQDGSTETMNEFELSSTNENSKDNSDQIYSMSLNSESSSDSAADDNPNSAHDEDVSEYE